MFVPITVCSDFTLFHGLDGSYFVLRFPIDGHLGSFCFLLLQTGSGMNVLVYFYGLVSFIP